MREIIFDTETTGLDPTKGDRLVEIGCVELLNGIPSGQTFHVYLDPQRDVPAEAFAVHGLSREFLTGKPLFKDVAADFLNFTAGAKLVAHNAEFDVKFLNAEFGRIGLPEIDRERVIDTLALARRRHPGAPNSLDALCARYKIDNSRRTKHGALLDSEILAEVYAELCGGRQTAMTLAADVTAARQEFRVTVSGPRASPIESTIAAEEFKSHAGFINSLGPDSIWAKLKAKAEIALPKP